MCLEGLVSFGLLSFLVVSSSTFWNPVKRRENDGSKDWNPVSELENSKVKEIVLYFPNTIPMDTGKGRECQQLNRTFSRRIDEHRELFGLSSDRVQTLSRPRSFFHSPWSKLRLSPDAHDYKSNT